MKQTLKLSVIAILIVAFMSCRKNDTNSGNSNTLPSVINTIVSQAIIDSLAKWGLAINKGTTPTQITGIYFLHPNFCFFDNGTIGNGQGLLFNDQKIKFVNQNNSNFTISVGANDVSVPGLDSSFASIATFISGHDSLFTVFSQQTGVENTIKDTALYVYSGTMTNTGIKNLQLAVYLQGKGGDANNTVLVKVGTCRMFKDNDGFSELSTSFYTDNPQSITVPNNPYPLFNKLGILSAGQ